MKARYNRHNLAVAKIAAKEGKQEHRAVTFTPTYTIATDGFRLAKVTTPQSESVIESNLKPIEAPDELLVPRDVILNIKLPKPNKDIPGQDAVYVTDQSKQMVTLTTYDIETGAKKNTEAAEVPANAVMFGELLHEVIEERGTTVRLNVDYLIDLLKIAKGMAEYVDIKVPTKKGRGVLLSCKGGDKQSFEGIIMPRSDHE